MQAGVRHARAARQPAVQPAQQDSGNFAAGRGLPVRRADAPRHQHQALERIRGRGRALHSVPQVFRSVPGGHRLWRCLHEHAQPAAQDGPAEHASRQVGRHADAECDRAVHHQPAACRHGERRLQGAACGSGLLQGGRAPPDCASAGHGRHGSGQGADHPLREQEVAGRPTDAYCPCAAGYPGSPVRAGDPRSAEHLGG